MPGMPAGFASGPPPGGSISPSQLASQAAYTVLGNNTAGTASPTAVAPSAWPATTSAAGFMSAADKVITNNLAIGFVAAGYRTTSSDITIDSDDVVVRVDTSGAARTVTLPAAAQGRAFLVKKDTTDANKITLVRAASESIEGTAANYDLPGSTFASRLSWYVWCDGTNWWVS